MILCREYSRSSRSWMLFMQESDCTCGLFLVDHWQYRKFCRHIYFISCCYRDIGLHCQRWIILLLWWTETRRCGFHQMGGQALLAVRCHLQGLSFRPSLINPRAGQGMIPSNRFGNGEDVEYYFGILDYAAVREGVGTTEAICIPCTRAAL